MNFANCWCSSVQSPLFLPLCSTTQTLYSPSFQPMLIYSLTAGPFAIANSAKMCNYLYFILSLPHKYYTHPVPQSSSQNATPPLSPTLLLVGTKIDLIPCLRNQIQFLILLTTLRLLDHYYTSLLQNRNNS